MKDLYHNVLATQAFNPINSTVTRTSIGIDRQGYAATSFVFSIGLSGDTLSGTVLWTLKLQHSDDNSTYTDVVLADLLNDNLTVVIDSSTEDEQAYSFGYRGTKRYIRGVATPTGTHTVGTPIGMVALLGSPSLAPVA